MIRSSSCPPWQPDNPGQTRRRSRRPRRCYTTRWDTILVATAVPGQNGGSKGQRTFWTIRSQEGAWGGWPLNQSNAGNLAPLCCFTGRGAGRAPGINATRWKSLRRLGADKSSEVARLAGLAFGILSAYQITTLERGEHGRPIDPMVLLTKLKAHG
jgi:hypothetical protein